MEKDLKKRRVLEKKRNSKAYSILFVGQCYYNHYYLSRELRKRGWRADVLNIDEDSSSQMFYHGEDYKCDSRTLKGNITQLLFFLTALFRYKIFHFSNAEGMCFGKFIHHLFNKLFGKGSEIKFLKFLGKKIVYTNNGCQDGVSQSSFSKWGAPSVCAICSWQNRSDVCSDEKNLKWGKFRNEMADYQCLLGGNRVDFNDAPSVHEAPWSYSLDKEFWRPDLLIPSNYLLAVPRKTVKLYHSVGNYDARSHGSQKQTIKSTEIYFDLVEKMQQEGLDVELLFFKDVPNRNLRYYQLQSDIVVDMLTFGWFGANIREALMLGIPSICYLRPEWLESARKEIPEYIDELPIISATPDTVYEVVKELVLNARKRREIGERSRAFAEKWFASDVAAVEAEKVYLSLLQND